jgi:hypothetical protein
MRTISKILLFALLSLTNIWLPFTTLAQNYKPKYLRQNDKAFTDLTVRITDDGWIDFRTDKPKINPTTFFDLYGAALGLDKIATNTPKSFTTSCQPRNTTRPTLSGIWLLALRLSRAGR